MNLMVMSVATWKFGKGTVARGRHPRRDGRRPVEVGRVPEVEALTQARHDEWMSSDIFHLDLAAIRIDGPRMRDYDGMLMLAAVGVETSGQSIRRWASSRTRPRSPPPCKPFSTT